MGKLTSFLKKGSNKNCIIVKILFFSFLLQTFSESMGPKFLSLSLSLSLLMCISSVPSSFKSFAFGTVYIKMWLPLQMYFPFPVSGKIFLHSILNYGTFWSVVPIKCHAVVSYWNTNIYSLMPITVMVLLCVNTAGTVCDFLYLLGSSTYWAVDLVCDDARKTSWHVPPLARVWYIMDNQLCQTS